ncbi:MAG: response regulator [SAR324 cluster bacterium]|nr:response regulator [SAR324 cluster bacterium]
MANILIVDDNKQTIQQVDELLCSFGYSSLYTLEPEFLFEILESKPVDLILLDVHMPGEDGVSLLKKVKEHPVFRSIPVIMLTGDTDERLLEKCFASGAMDFINKPIHDIVLKSRVKSALSNRDHILALRKKSSSLKNVLQIATMGMWEFDCSNRYMKWSSEMYQIFDRTAESFPSSIGNFFHVIHPEDIKIVKPYLHDLFESNKVAGPLDFRIIRPDESVRIVHQQAEVLEKEGKPVHILGITQDITDQQRSTALQHAYRRQNQIREEERERLARDLHDEVIQIFSMLNLKINVSAKSGCSSESEYCWLRDNFQSCQELIHTGNQTLRQIINDLYPSILKDLGLAPALRAHIRDLNERMNLQIELHVSSGLESWPAEIELAVFRITQEALNNVVKHAKTPHAQVMIGQRENILWLQIEDQGQGMFLEEMNLKSMPKSLGLFLMKERVSQLGGKITIHSQLGQGTSIFLEIPHSPIERK